MSEAFAKRLFIAREEAFAEMFPGSSYDRWDMLDPETRSVWILQARILLDTLADDDEVLFRMGCIEYEIEPPEKLSTALRVTLVSMARAEANAFLQALGEVQP